MLLARPFPYANLNKRQYNDSIDRRTRGRNGNRQQCPTHLGMRNDPKISELTVSQLRRLIRETVQEAVAEVIIEINAIAQAEEAMEDDAEIADFLMQTMQGLPYGDYLDNSHLDD
jgi:hypothetical protein